MRHPIRAARGGRGIARPLGRHIPRRWTLALTSITIAMLVAGAAGAALQDSDGDGVADDGDVSGSANDNPCTNLVAVSCDDNCRFVANTNQADGDGDLIGDACDVPAFDPDPQDDSFDLTTGQETESPKLRWQQGPPVFLDRTAALAAPPIDLEDGSQCLFVDIPFTPQLANVSVDYVIPTDRPPYGGTVCCTWQADCNFGCLTDATSVNDCPAGISCRDFPDFTQCILQFDPNYDPNDPDEQTALMNLDPAIRDQVGIAARTPGSVCDGLSAGFGDFFPIDACCFNQTTTRAVPWGNNRSAITDVDLDRHSFGCDNCPDTYNPSQIDADGDGRGAECDSDDSNRWRCGDSEFDTCDDCSSGFFDPFNDGINPNGDEICTPEPGQAPMLVAGLLLLLLLGRQRHLPPSPAPVVSRLAR